MRVLITGITGFAGVHLAEALIARGVGTIFGTSRRAQWPDDKRHLEQNTELRSCDLCDFAGTTALIREVQPDCIYHLAGYANAGRSFQEAAAAWAGNLTATLSLYDAVHRWGGQARILYVGSGLIYGDAATSGCAIDETWELRPSNPYAASKAAADLASYQHTKFPGLDIVRARPFNHIGPGQAPNYAAAHFARQIAAIENWIQPPLLETGNLGAMRDLTDVRDVVEAYVLLMEKGRTGDCYNVATGETHSMEFVLNCLLELARVRVEVRQQAKLLRASETAVVCGDASKLRRETGWKPRFELKQTLDDALDHWRATFSSRRQLLSA